MTPQEALTRIFLSRQTIAGWEKDGMSGPSLARIQLLAAELQILDKLKAEFPETAETVDPLIVRYQQLLLKTKLTLN